MTVKVTCLGGAVLDLIYGVDDLPSEDGKSLARSFTESGGGMAANAAVIVSRLGGQAVWCGRVGDDDKGRRILEGLRHERVDVRTAQVLPGVRSAHSIVLKDRSGNRAIILYRSDDLNRDPSWLPIDKLLDADAVLADNRWIEGTVALLSAARIKGIPAVLDADSAGDNNTLAAVRAASHVVFSGPGLADLFKTNSPEEGLRRAVEHTPFVAVTLGSRGVHWIDASGEFRHLAAFPIDAVETVGAGDIFHGAFAFALGRGQPEEDGLRFAAAAAALKCAGEGGRDSFPRIRQVEALLQANPPSSRAAVASRTENQEPQT